MVTLASEQLRAVAKERSITSEARDLLGNLSDALDDMVELDSWAAVDLRTAFDPDTSIRPPATALWLGRCLDVLVFAPVASTWLGLMVATAAYKNTLNDPKLAGLNFLQRWQAGFDGRLWGHLSFDRVAIITFSLVALVFTLAIVHLVFRSWAEQGSKARVSRQLSTALTAAERALAPVRLGAVGRVATEVGKVSAEVAKTADEIKKVGEAAERSQEAAAKSIERVSGAMAAVQAAAADVGQAVMDMGDKLAEATIANAAVADTEAEFGEKLLDATEKLDTSVATLVDRLGAAIAATGDDFSGKLIGANDKLVGATRKLDLTVGGLADRLTAAVTAGETGLARSVEQSTEQVGTALAELKAAIAENAGKVGGLLTEIKDMATDNTGRLTDVVTSLGTLDRLDVDVQRLIKGIDRLSRAIDDFKISPVAMISPLADGDGYAHPRPHPEVRVMVDDEDGKGVSRSWARSLLPPFHRRL